MLSTQALVVLITLGLLPLSLQAQALDCASEGKVYNECGSSCLLTCDNYQSPPICLTVCMEGCFCPEGKVEHDGQCIFTYDCPSEVTPSTAPPAPPTLIVEPPLCPPEKNYSECGSACPLSCDNPQQLPCVLSCVVGCFCPPGTVEQGSTCVAPEECPGVEATTPPPTPPQCLEGKIYSECGSPCPISCDHPGDNPCVFGCAVGCFCPLGTVELGDTCVAPEECPSVEVTTPPPTPPQCPEGKIYSECGSPCPISCDHPGDNPCVFGCAVGCFCPSGTVELGDTCVAPEECPSVEVTTPPPTPPQCPEGKSYSECGSPCPISCDHPGDNPCVFGCAVGCFCPSGTVELGDTCVAPEECPSVEVTTPPPTPPQCPEGKIYSECGSPCPISCDHPGDNPCVFRCAVGCFCPLGTVELGDTCVAPEECPSVEVTTPPPTPPQCPEGKSYSECGSPCPISCDHPGDNPCVFSCAVGCFCPSGTVELGDTCVAPEECPGQVVTTTEQPTACSGGKEYRECGPVCKDTCDSKYGSELNPCFSLRCFPGCFCADGMIEHEGQCIRDVDCPNHPCQEFQCPNDFRCVLDDSLRPRCERSLYVPCSGLVPLACDSEFLRCVVENTTRHATCLPSCFLDNGNCNSDQTCVVATTEHGSTVHCLNRDELSSECPAGMVMNECGSSCQETCDDIVNGGIKICPLICGPADCTCPYGLVRYRDRCVDPKECYSLKIYPPPINPLPTTRTDVVLLKLSTTDRSVSKSEFHKVQDQFLKSLELLLSDYTGVKVELHAVLESDGGLELYVLLSGGDVSAESVESFIGQLTAESLILPIDNVVVVDLPQVGPSAHGGISWITLGGIIGASFLVLTVLVVTLIVSCCCYCAIKRKRKQRSKEKYHQSSNSKPLPPTYSQLVSEGMGYVPEKKLNP